VYRIPASSISFVFTGMDEDILKAQKTDEAGLEKVNETIRNVRQKLWQKSGSF